MARSNYRGRKRKCAHKSKAVIEKQSGDKVDSSRSDSNSTDHDEENLKSPKKKVRWGLTANAEDDVENSMEKSDSDTAERDQTADENVFHIIVTFRCSVCSLGTLYRLYWRYVHNSKLAFLTSLTGIYFAY